MKDKPAVYMTAVEAGIAINLELLSTSIYLTFLGEEEATMMPSFERFPGPLYNTYQKSQRVKNLTYY